MLREVIDSSDLLELDETRDLVRKVAVPERSRLVLRDMPADATEEEVRKLFEHDECGDAVDVEKEHVTNTWFVTFRTEEDCLKTHRFLQSHSEFRPGAHVHSRVTDAPPAATVSRFDYPHPGAEPFFPGLFSLISTNFASYPNSICVSISLCFCQRGPLLKQPFALALATHR